MSSYATSSHLRLQFSADEPYSEWKRPFLGDLVRICFVLKLWEKNKVLDTHSRKINLQINV
jgi:hypothetical protein